MLTNDTDADGMGPDSPLSPEEQAEDLRIMAEALSAKIQARARVLCKLGDLSGAEAFLEGVRAFIARPLACFHECNTKEARNDRGSV